MVSPLRHAALDRRVAQEGVSDEVVAVYGDWLLEHGHPAPDAWTDPAARGAVVDPFLKEHFDLPELVWHQSLITRVGLVELPASPDQEALDNEAILEMILTHPSAFLVHQLRREVSASGTSDLTGLAYAPPTLGRLELTDPEVFQRADEKAVSLSSLRAPNLNDLRLRVSRLFDLPALPSLRRLEVFVAEPQPLVDLALPDLRVLHVWADGTSKDARFLIQQAPRLEVVGLYGGAWDVLETLPASVHTVVIGAGPQPDWTSLEAMVPTSVQRIAVQGIVAQTIGQPHPEPHGRVSMTTDPDLPLPPRFG